jgi:hypothetical protein
MILLLRPRVHVVQPEQHAVVHVDAGVHVVQERVLGVLGHAGRWLLDAHALLQPERVRVQIIVESVGGADDVRTANDVRVVRARIVLACAAVLVPEGAHAQVEARVLDDVVDIGRQADEGLRDADLRALLVDIVERRIGEVERLDGDLALHHAVAVAEKHLRPRPLRIGRRLPAVKLATGHLQIADRRLALANERRDTRAEAEIHRGTKVAVISEPPLVVGVRSRAAVAPVRHPRPANRRMASGCALGTSGSSSARRGGRRSGRRLILELYDGCRRAGPRALAQGDSFPCGVLRRGVLSAGSGDRKHHSAGDTTAHEQRKNQSPHTAPELTIALGSR